MRNNPTVIPMSTGFSAQLNGASVADLVQMYCQTRSRAVVEVRSGLQIGYLFFDEGRVVHAELGTLVGEPAFTRILGLSAGAFQPSLRHWPPRETIHSPVEGLLLRAAQALDEERRGSSLAAHEETPTASGAVRTSVTRSVGSTETRSAPPKGVTTPRQAATPRRVNDGASGVRIDHSGAVVSQRGAKAEQLADLMAFVTPLFDVIGEELGIGETRGADFQGAGDTEVLLRLEPDGSWVGAVGQTHELVELKRRLGVL